MTAVRFGQRVKRLRELRGWTQKDLADNADISQGHISSIELGRTSNAGLETIQKLVETLETSADYLLGRENDRRPHPHSVLDSLTEEEAELVQTYQELRPPIRQKLVDLLRIVYQSPDSRSEDTV
jgi:transcriptional regulator with XRE-family HTH domain